MLHVDQMVLYTFYAELRRSAFSKVELKLGNHENEVKYKILVGFKADCA